MSKPKRKLWVEFEEPKQVEASLTYCPGREVHERVTHISIKWHGKWLKLPKVHLYHKVKRGMRVLHVYSCTDAKMDLFFRIVHDARRQNVYVVGADGKYTDSFG